MEQYSNTNAIAKSVESSMEMNFANEIAALCYSKYMNLPKTGKPKEEREWTHVAGIVKVDDWQKDSDCLSNVPKDVVALGTGSKCIGKSKMSPTGDILNDSHAEVMARRGFLRYLYHQVLMTYQTGSSEIFKCFSGGKCVIKGNVTFHFFTSHVPCGDASIIPKVPLSETDVGLRLKCGAGQSVLSRAKWATSHCIMAPTERVNCNFSHADIPGGVAVQTMEGEECNVRRRANCDKRKYCNIEGCEEESGSKHIKANLSPGRAKMGSGKERSAMNNNVEKPEVPVSDDIYRTGAKCLPFQSLQDSHLPGACYHVVGALRTKPGRGEPTQSLSCSDKFARWNVVGLQGALLSLLLNEPIYFESVIVGGGGPFSKMSLKRAIIDRLIYQNNGKKNSSEDKKMDQGFSLSEGLSLPSKYGVHCPLILQSTLPFEHARMPNGAKQPCPSSIVWCQVPERALEVAVEGKKQGITKKVAHTLAGRLLVCKKELLRQFVNVVLSMPDPALHLPAVLKMSDVAEIEQRLVKIPYRQLKNLSDEYKQAWNTVRAACFPSWTATCESLQSFSLTD